MPSIRTAVGLARLGLWYVSLAVLKRLVPVRPLARTLWVSSVTRDPTGAAVALARVTRLRQLLGEREGDCLETSLILYRELSRAGMRPVLVVGLTQAPGGPQGHAWVEVDGKPMMESPRGLARFTRVAAFAARGVPEVRSVG